MSHPTHKLFEAYALITVAALALLALSYWRDHERFASQIGTAVQSAALHPRALVPADSAFLYAPQPNSPAFPEPSDIVR